MHCEYYLCWLSQPSPGEAADRTLMDTEPRSAAKSFALLEETGEDSMTVWVGLTAETAEPYICGFKLVTTCTVRKGR